MKYPQHVASLYMPTRDTMLQCGAARMVDMVTQASAQAQSAPAPLVQLLVAPNHAVPGLFTMSPIGKPASQLSSQPATLVIGSVYPCSAFLGLSMSGPLGLSGPFFGLSVRLCAPRSFLRSSRPL